MSPFRANVAIALIATACLQPVAVARVNAPVGVGPRDLSIPAGAVVADDGASLEKLLAEGPAEIWLRAKTYEGDFRIARPLNLRGEKGAQLDGGGRGSVLSIEADDVVVDNLTLRNGGHRATSEDAAVKAKGDRVSLEHLYADETMFGLVLAECGQCRVVENHVRGVAGDELRGDGIKLWESDDALVKGNFVEESRDLVVWYSRRALLEKNVVTRSRYGAHFMYAHDSVVRGCRIVDNVVGIFVMYSARVRVEANVLAGARGAAGVGIGFKESDGVALNDNALVGNTTGTYLDRTPRMATDPVEFSGNRFALNGVAIRFHSSEEGLVFKGNAFQQNLVLAEVEGGGTAMKTRFSGNYFSEYVGYDLNADGIGDVAFQQKHLTGELTDAYPALRLFQGTLAMDLLGAVAQAAPVLASHLLLVDPAPAMWPTASMEVL